MARVIYEVYEGNEKVFEGTREFVLQAVGLSKEGSLSSFINRGILLKKKYRVVKVVKKDSDDKLDYLVEHLKLYGNTVMLEDPTPYLEKLEELGYKVKVSKFKLNTSNTIVLNEEAKTEYKKKRGKPSENVVTSHYIELV